MKKLAILVALAVAGTAAAATAVANPHAEKKRLRKPDMALASRVGLHGADLAGGWSATAPVPYGDGTQTTCASYDPDLSRFTITGRSHGAFAHTAAQRVDSSVEIYPSAAQARGDFVTGNGNHRAIRRCIAAQVLKGLRNSGARASHLTTSFTSLRRIGERSMRLSVSVELTQGRTTVPLYFDVLAFQRARVQAALLFTSVGRRMPGELRLTLALERRVPR
jgi:hypothetical protein